jgi:hypothetical protein
MSRATEYRGYAAQCIRVARQTEKPEDKALLLEMAEKWRELADKIEKSSNKTADS